MISRKELSALALRNGISIGAQERDYAQHLFCYCLYSGESSLIFKGGTCLRMAFGLNRFSEDLDFTSKKNSNPGGEVRKAAEKLGLFGVEAEVRKGRGEKSSFRLLLEGPLFDGKEISKGSIRIDVSERNDAFGSKTALINQSYSEIPPFLAKVMPEDEILAEKARALVERSKARDLFDAWFLLKKGVAFEKTRVEKKMNFVGKKFSKKGLIEGIEKAGSDWERDLKPLIPLLPSFEQVKRETLAEVEKI